MKLCLEIDFLKQFGLTFPSFQVGLLTANQRVSVRVRQHLIITIDDTICYDISFVTLASALT